MDKLLSELENTVFAIENIEKIQKQICIEYIEKFFNKNTMSDILKQVSKDSFFKLHIDIDYSIISLESYNFQRNFMNLYLNKIQEHINYNVIDSMDYCYSKILKHYNLKDSLSNDKFCFKVNKSNFKNIIRIFGIDLIKIDMSEVMSFKEKKIQAFDLEIDEALSSVHIELI